MSPPTERAASHASRGDKYRSEDRPFRPMSTEPADVTSLDQAVLERLRCPRCGARIRRDDGLLACEDGHPVPLRDGIIDASAEAVDEETSRTLASFGFEWTTFDRVEPEDREFWERYFADVPLDELGEEIAIDAGCGKGRFAYFTAPRVRSLVALDGSDAVRSAARNLEGMRNAVVVRSDIRTPPFADESFGFVYCLGVLHHLTDPHEGFRRLVRLLAPGGRLLIYVYSRPEGGGVRATALRAATALRRWTITLPHRTLRTLSYPLAAVLYATVVLPGRLGDRARFPALARLPLAVYRGRPLRSLWLDTFDRLSAPIEHRYVWSELEPWFREAGLDVQAVREDAGLIVLARKGPA